MHARGIWSFCVAAVVSPLVAVPVAESGAAPPAEGDAVLYVPGDEPALLPRFWMIRSVGADGIPHADRRTYEIVDPETGDTHFVAERDLWMWRARVALRPDRDRRDRRTAGRSKSTP